MSRTVFVNGEYLPATEARISAWDGGWLHGAGLFETMKARNGKVFRLQAHLDRMMASAEKLLIGLERSDLPLTSDFDELLRRNGLPDARLRLTISAGAMIGVERDDSTDDRGRPKLTVCISAAPLVGYPAEFYQSGLTVTVSPFRVATTDPLAGHKCTSYLPRLLALREAHAKGCNEALWFNTDNLLSEGSISNVFVVRDGKLLTPMLDAPALPGITRAAVLDLASEAGIAAEERPLTVNDVLDADEVLLTNTIMEVMPVCRVERKEIGTGKPGEMTGRLLEAYRGLVARECGVGRS